MTLESPTISNRFFILSLTLTGIVILVGLFVPLMDNDAAHHANIALHMYQTGNYADLVDNGAAYLDKPHLHFWLCAWSYHLFGVTTFAYKFPSALFAILGFYSVYALGKELYDRNAGRLSCIFYASSFAILLSLNDVRMDALLSSFVAFASWQLVAWLNSRKFLHLVGSAAGLAAGFSVKGDIGIVVPLVFMALYIFSSRQWKNLLRWEWLMLVVITALFMTPVLYCYYLQFNLHPETVVRGQDHINGVKFILFNQNVQRFSGEMSHDAHRDYLFFFYTFIWAFAPWSLIAFPSVFWQVVKRAHFFLGGTVLFIAAVITLAGSKLPHYLNISLPFAAVSAAVFFLQNYGKARWRSYFNIVRWVALISIVSIAAAVNLWLFTPSVAGIAGIILLLVGTLYSQRGIYFSGVETKIWGPLSATIFLFLLLNLNFYPKLLRYQAGKELAGHFDKVDLQKVFFWPGTYSSSFCFYTKTLRKEFSDSLIGKDCWLLYDVKDEKAILAKGVHIGEKVSAVDYEITKVTAKFLLRRSRLSQCSEMVLAHIGDRPVLLRNAIQ